MNGLIRWTAVLGLMIGAASTTAQPADPSTLQSISAAFEQTRAAGSLRVTTQSLTEISGLPQGMSFGSQSQAAYDLARGANGWNAAGQSSQSITLPNGATTITTETILLDGTLYLRLSGLPEQMANQTPQGWFDTSAMEGGFGAANADAATLLGTLALPVNAESVTAISELPSDTLNGQTMRIYQLTLDPAVVLASEAAGLLGGLGGGMGMMMGGGNLMMGANPQGGGNFTPPAGAPDVTQLQAAEPPAPEDFQITFAVYIGADGYVHRIYSVIASQGEAGQPGLTLTSISDYSDFGTPVQITAPALGS